MKKVLLAIDCVDKYFDNNQETYFQKTQDILYFLKQTIKKFYDNDDIIFFINSDESSTYEKFIVKDKRYTIINKQKYSAFHNTPLYMYLKDLCNNKIEDLEVHIIGVWTDTNILFTAEELSNYGIKTIVYDKGTITDTKGGQTFAIKLMEKNLGINII